MKTKATITLALLCSYMFVLTAMGQKEKVQTAMVYQFTRLIEWCPMAQQGDFTIYMLGTESLLHNELSTLQNRSVQNQPIKVKTVNSINEISNANIVIVTKSRITDLQAVMTHIGSSCTLVIADWAGAAKQGAAFSFIEEGDRVQFEMNSQYANRHSLSVSNRLTELAKNVF